MGAATTVARRCSGCGAQVEIPAGELSTKCSYCGSPLVDAERGAHQYDAVAPFRIVRSVAQDRLRGYLSGKFWAPTKVRRTAVSGRDLRGVLVPFWVYDGVVRSEYDARVGIYWYRTETYTDSQGKTRTRTVRETEWFHMPGSAARRVFDHLVSGSVGLPEQESNALEPFDLGWAVPFDARLLSGWEAELPSIGREPADETAASELRDLEAARIGHHLLPGDTNQLTSISSSVDVEARRSVLLPVWIASFRTAGKPCRVVINGQSGKVVGKIPVSPWKVTAAVLLVVIVVVLGLVAGGVIG